MERAVVHSDLIKEEIQPNEMLDHYFALLKSDIDKLWSPQPLNETGCPVTEEMARRNSFTKMGVQFYISQTYGNVYASPRLDHDQLIQFYKKSKGRKYWLTEIWPKTRLARERKVIHPQWQWIENNINQYIKKEKLCGAEFYPNHWGYFYGAREIVPGLKYKLVDPLFSPDMVEGAANISDLIGLVDDEELDVVFLFEALERSENPFRTLQKARNKLKIGGLCFITCLLSSGFELQILGSKSDVYVPPERLNVLSVEGMKALIEKAESFDIMEFSTPGVLDIPNVIKALDRVPHTSFFNYIFKQRKDPHLIQSFQDFLQIYQLGTFGRIVLRKR